MGGTYIGAKDVGRGVAVTGALVGQFNCGQQKWAILHRRHLVSAPAQTRTIGWSGNVRHTSVETSSSSGHELDRDRL